MGEISAEEKRINEILINSLKSNFDIQCVGVVSKKGKARVHVVAYFNGIKISEDHFTKEMLEDPE